MKKMIISAMVVLLVAGGAYVVLAKTEPGAMIGRAMADSNEMMAMHKKMMDGGMPGGPMGMCPMCMSMCQRMMRCEVVATPDGGVVVMTGQKLTKYDKDLNMVKEVEMKIDTEKMQKDMAKMMENCPMCKKMMDSKKIMEPKDMMK